MSGDAMYGKAFRELVEALRVLGNCASSTHILELADEGTETPLRGDVQSFWLMANAATEARRAWGKR